MALNVKKLKSEVNEIEGVLQFKIDIPFDVKFVCLYLFEADGKKILIDAGLYFRDWIKLFTEGLTEKNLSLKDIDYCFISHEHLDHVGIVKKIKRANPNVQVLMHEITDKNIKWMADRANDDEIKEAANDVAKEMMTYGITDYYSKRVVQYFTTWPKMYRYVKPDVVLHDEDEIEIGSHKLKIIWTPGHALGHICIFDANTRFLYSGDHILSRITPHIGIFNTSPVIRQSHDFDNILDLYLKSLDKIDALNPKIIFPSHQEVIYNPHERILEIKEHHKNRLNEITNMIKNKPMTPFKISQIHFGEDLDEMNMFLALNEVLSHLIYLERQERVKRIEKDGTFLFSS